MFKQTKRSIHQAFANPIFRHAVVIVAACLLWLGVAVPGFADLQVVSETEGERITTYYKANRIAAPTPDGANMILFCETEEVVLVSPSGEQRYWQGNINELQEALEGLMGGLTEALSDAPEGLGALFGDLFGGSSDTVEVRITPNGSDAIAGYEADKYVVETNSGNGWNTFEELWLANGLMKQIQSEVGSCFNLSQDMLDSISSAAVAMPELEAVLSSQEYQALVEAGYPVRQRQTMRMFGMETTTKTEVLEVSNASIAEEKFQIPAGYEQVSSPVELLGI